MDHSSKPALWRGSRATLIGLLSGVLLAWGSVASAAPCEATVQADDNVRFDTSEITVDRSCSQFTVHLKNTGTLPATSMGHDWVLSREADMDAVCQDGVDAGMKAGYLKPDDPRVIAHTKLIGGGQSDSVTFDTSLLKPGEDYAFFCSFPGHHATMKGKLKF